MWFGFQKPSWTQMDGNQWVLGDGTFLTHSPKMQVTVHSLWKQFVRLSAYICRHSQKNEPGRLYSSTISPTYPWKIPRTLHQRFLKEFLSLWGLGKSGVSSQGTSMWAKSLNSGILSMCWEPSCVEGADVLDWSPFPCLLRKPAGRLGEVSPCERSEN